VAVSDPFAIAGEVNATRQAKSSIARIFFMFPPI